MCYSPPSLLVFSKYFRASSASRVCSIRGRTFNNDQAQRPSTINKSMNSITRCYVLLTRGRPWEISFPVYSPFCLLFSCFFPALLSSSWSTLLWNLFRYLSSCISLNRNHRLLENTKSALFPPLVFGSRYICTTDYLPLRLRKTRHVQRSDLFRVYFFKWYFLVPRFVILDSCDVFGS